MLQKKYPKLIVILGPTASGKTELALKLAKKFNGEIVSSDSRQIYKEMFIGTASPCSNKLNDNLEFQKPIYIAKIPHYILHVVSPKKEYNMAIYKKMAIKIIKNIQTRNKLPLLVGGTGLYISNIVDNFKIPTVPPNKKLREKIKNEIEKYGIEKIYQKLLTLDPMAEKFIQKNNPHRIIRALEVCLITGKPFSIQRQKNNPIFETLQLGIKISREKLYKKINQRVDQMIKNGLLEETMGLTKKYPWNLQSMNGIGYKQIGMYLRNEINLDTAIELIKRDTRRYARRQITWFKKDKRIHWISTQKQAEKIIKKTLSQQT